MTSDVVVGVKPTWKKIIDFPLVTMLIAAIIFFVGSRFAPPLHEEVPVAA